MESSEETTATFGGICEQFTICKPKLYTLTIATNPKLSLQYPQIYNRNQLRVQKMTLCSDKARQYSESGPFKSDLFHEHSVIQFQHFDCHNDLVPHVL